MNKNFVLEMGLQPVTNRFQIDANTSAPSFPMTLSMSPWRSIVLQTPFPVDEVRPRFDWLTVYEPEEHLDELIEEILKSVSIGLGDKIRGLSFKDKTLVERFRNQFFSDAACIDPTGQLGLMRSYGGVETLQSVFIEENIETFCEKIGTCKLLIIRHTLEHFYQLPALTSFIKKSIGKDGYALIEIPDCEKGIKNGDCAILWEEHIHYFTAASFAQCMRENGLEIILQKTWNYELEDCMCFLVKNASNSDQQTKNFEAQVEDADLLWSYSKRLNQNRVAIQTSIEKFKTQGKVVSIFGAGHLTSTFISINGISNQIDFVIDDNPKKIGLYMPNGGIEIVSSSVLSANPDQVCLLGLNPNHHDLIRKKHSTFLASGGRMLSIFPCTPDSLIQ